MATWKGTPKKFNCEIYYKPNYEHSGYEDIEYTWEYNTTVDTLTIKETSSEGLTEQFMPPDHAKALLYTIASWYSTYNSKEELKQLLNELLFEEIDANNKRN